MYDTLSRYTVVIFVCVAVLHGILVHLLTFKIYVKPKKEKLSNLVEVSRGEFCKQFLIVIVQNFFIRTGLLNHPSCHQKINKKSQGSVIFTSYFVNQTFIVD